ncbi:hypothetical protein AB0D13_40640 [Streptomyces sp. NPDC048430]|uniref:hypothetical protein n=1 Tax=Streptomyces sp. NPDC048430 TaxID=3155388 RepID=UPI0034496412
MTAQALVELPLRLTITEEVTYSWRHRTAVPAAISADLPALAEWLTQNEDPWVSDWDPSDADSAEHGTCSLTVDEVQIRDLDTDPDRLQPTPQDVHDQALDGAAYAAMHLLRAELPTLTMTAVPQPSTMRGAGGDREAVASWDGLLPGDVTITNGCRFLFHIDGLAERTADAIAAAVDEVCDPAAQTWDADGVFSVQIGEATRAEAVDLARIIARYSTPDH